MNQVVPRQANVYVALSNWPYVPAIVLYDYQTTRTGKHPKAFLQGFSGYLHVDGYAGYHDLPKVELVGCWAHARRENHCQRIFNTEKSCSAKIGLQFCTKLFAIDKKINKMENVTIGPLNEQVGTI